MKHNRKIAFIYSIMTVALSVAAVFFQGSLFQNYYDDKIGLYRSGEIAPSLFNVFLVLSLLLIVTCVMFFKKDEMPKKLKHNSVMTMIMSAFCGVLLVMSAVLFLSSMNPASFHGNSTVTVYKLRFILSIIAFPSALYFLSVTLRKTEYTESLALLSFFPTLWTLLYLMSIYFDHSVLLNSPPRILHQLALVALMLFQLYEARALIGKPFPRVYFIIASATVVLLSTSAVARVLPLFSERQPVSCDTGFVCYEVAVALYVLSRALSFASTPLTEPVNNETEGDVTPEPEASETTEGPAEDITADTKEKI